jgi:hypothetical protein
VDSCVSVFSSIDERAALRTAENVFVHRQPYNDSILATIGFTIEKNAANAKLTIGPALAGILFVKILPLIELAR